MKSANLAQTAATDQNCRRQNQDEGTSHDPSDRVAGDQATGGGHAASDTAHRLASARRNAGLTLADIARECCVSQHYLKAIDEGRFDRLPELTFAVGFVRAYADTVGENADDVAAGFKREMRSTSSPALVSTPLAAEKNARRVPGWLAPISGLLGVLVSVFWIGSGVLVAPTANTRPDDNIALSEVRAHIGAPEAPFVAAVDSILPAAYADETPSEPATRVELLFAAQEDSWIRLVEPDGHELWSGVLHAGQEYRPLVTPGVRVSASNAGALIISVEDKALPALGTRGQVVLDAPLLDTI